MSGFNFTTPSPSSNNNVVSTVPTQNVLVPNSAPIKTKEELLRKLSSISSAANIKAQIEKVNIDPNHRSQETVVGMERIFGIIHAIPDTDFTKSETDILVWTYISQLEGLYRSYEEARSESTLQSKIDTLKNIDLDFEISYKSWDAFKKDIMDEAVGLSVENQRKLGLFLDHETKPVIESLIKMQSEFNAEQIGQRIDSLLDAVISTPNNPDGSITLALNENSALGSVVQGVIASGVNTISPGSMVPPIQYENGQITFSSKEEAITILGETKKGLQNLESHISSFISGANDFFRNTVLEGLKSGLSIAWDITWFLEGWWLNMLKTYGEFTWEYPWVGIPFAAGVAFALSRALESAASGVDFKVINGIGESITDLASIYKEAGLIKESQEMIEMEKRFQNLYPEGGLNILDNYKKLGQLYREFQSWRGTQVGDSIRWMTSYAGDIADNGKVFDFDNIYNLTKGREMPNRFIRTVNAGKDIALLPWKLGFIYLNKGPDGGIMGWQLRNKGLIVQDFAEQIKASVIKFKNLFAILDRIALLDDLKISADELKKLKGDIIKEYTSRLPGAKVDLLKKTRIERDGISFKKVSIDEIAAQKIDEFLSSKVSSTELYPDKFKNLIGELRDNAKEFNDKRVEIKKVKERYIDYIKYHPDISDIKEDALKTRVEILSNISKNKDDFERELLQTMRSEFGLPHTTTEIDTFIEEVKNLGGIQTKDRRQDKAKVFDLLHQGLTSGKIDQVEHDRRVGEVNVFYKDNKTLWIPHYVEALDKLVEGEDVSSISYSTISSTTNNNIDTYLSTKKRSGLGLGKSPVPRTTPSPSTTATPRTTPATMTTPGPTKTTVSPPEAIETHNELLKKDGYERLYRLALEIELREENKEDVLNIRARQSEIRQKIANGTISDKTTLSKAIKEIGSAYGYTSKIRTIEDIRLDIAARTKTTQAMRKVLSETAVKSPKSFYDYVSKAIRDGSILRKTM